MAEKNSQGGIEKIKKDMFELRDDKRAEHSKRFFKTGPGQYGAGDAFLGLTVPQVRSIAKVYLNLEEQSLKDMLDSPWHKIRLCALLIMVGKFKKADGDTRKQIVDLYLSKSDRVNNWDLVDLSVGQILGEWLIDKERSILYELATSENLWRRRMAIVATIAFIRRSEFDDTFNLAEMLLDDREDLIHKATGWMLREVGKRDELRLRSFLTEHYVKLPRTALRYAIERFPESERRAWLKGPVIRNDGEKAY